MAETRAEPTAGDSSARAGYAEQALFEYSPFNLWVTTALLYGLLVGAYALAAFIDGTPWIVSRASSVALDANARLALILSLIGCSSLCLQRWSRLRELADASAIERALRPGVEWAPRFSPGRLRLFTAFGLAVGLVAAALLTPWRGAAPHPALAAWFSVVIVGLGALFFRGLALTGDGARHARAVIEGGLEIDLLRIERLYPWGRAAARTSLVWFTVSAAALLLVASSGLSLSAAAILIACVAIGLWVFVGTLTLVHHQIRAAKAAELDSLRGEIIGLRRGLDGDPAAAPKLQSLLAYEARIADAPEWPFDQTILVRLAASSLILTVPWFGQAFAGLLVSQLGKLQP